MGLLKNLRIGARIAFGYVTVLALMAGLFLAGWLTLSTLGGQLGDLTVAGSTALKASDAQVELVRLRLDTQVFAANGAEAALSAIKTDVDRLQKAFDMMGQMRTTDERARDLLVFNDFLDKFRAELAPLVSGRQKRERTLREEFRVLGPEARKKLVEMQDAAVARQDLVGAITLSRVLDQWLGARLQVSRFLNEPEEKSGEEARQRLSEADRALKAYIAQQADAKVRQAGTEVLAMIERYGEKAGELIPVVLQNAHSVGEALPDIGARLDKALDAFQDRMQRRMHETEGAAQHGIVQAERLTVGIGVTVTLLGFALALVIGRSVLGSLGKALDTLNDAARQVATGSNQASIAISQVSEGARTQMNAVKQIGVAIKQSANAIEDVAGSSSQTYKFTKDAVGMVDNALRNVLDLDRLVKTISENSRNISRITNVITRIANQTNMLSLNAAIEAARAGEHGRGFAVVAEEVRKLAEEVANSAQEIAEIVAAANAEAEKGVAVSHEVGDDMGKIGDVFRQIERMASVIASATTQQQASTKEIDATVQSLAQISESNATASEEILATMNELVKIADSARTGAENFKAIM